MVKRNLGIGLFLGCLVLMLVNACTPVNSHTRIKKTPDEYTRNYCCGEVNVPKSAEKGSPWIVYSDRENNPSFFNPGGKIKMKEASYLEAFAVIGEEGEYLKLVKYDPAVFEERKVKDPAKAEYFGWMKKDNLILSSRAMTDVATGFIMKMITMFRDTFPLSRTEDYFSNDSLVLFSEPELVNPIGMVPFQKPIYLAKRSFDRSKCLVIGKENISPENSSELVSGWISSSLVIPMGELLYADYSTMPIQDVSFIRYDKGSYPVPKTSYARYLRSFNLPDFIGLNPVYSIREGNDDVVTIKSTVPVSLMNDENNKVSSLAATPISRPYYEDLSRDLKHINIMVVFSGQNQVHEKFEQYVNYIQKLNGVIKNDAKDFSFRLGYLVGFDAKNTRLSKCKPKENVSGVLAALEKYADDRMRRKATFDTDAWGALKNALRMLQPYKNEYNIIVLIGENGNQKEQIDDALVNEIVKVNGHIVACQLYANKGNVFNNFVLQVEDMISRSAEKMSKEKKKKLVHSSQLTATNRYKEFAENVYGLDYPRHSMVPGWVIFPKQKENLSPDLLIAYTDSMIRNVERDADNILNRIQLSFKEAGVGHTAINPMWLRLGEMPADYQVEPRLFQPLIAMNPHTNFSVNLKVEMSKLKTGKYVLFVSESELARIRTFIDDLLQERVDYKYSASNNKKGNNRSCPDMMRAPRPTSANVGHRQYKSTKKARKHMQKAYLRWAQDEKVYPIKKKKLKKMSLSQNQQQVMSIPSFEPLLFSTTVKALKRGMTDEQLDKLQEYLAEKQKALEEAIVNDSKFEINGQVYYRVDAENLP